jgi:transcriptional regulator
MVLQNIPRVVSYALGKQLENNLGVSLMTEDEQRDVIERILLQADESEVKVSFLGGSEDQHIYAGAIMGLSDYPHELHIIYSYTKLIEILTEELETTSLGAIEHYENNIAGTLCNMTDDEGCPMVVDDYTIFL